MTGSRLDTARDLSVVGGYTNIGYRIRSRGWSPLPRMESKVVLITGATSGLGLAAADGFARLGATVWPAVRRRERGDAARARILDHLAFNRVGDRALAGLREVLSGPKRGALGTAA